MPCMASGQRVLLTSPSVSLTSHKDRNDRGNVCDTGSENKNCSGPQQEVAQNPYMPEVARGEEP